MFLVQANCCGATGWTEDGTDLDAAVRCSTPAGNPPGSAEGSCAADGRSHEEHVAHVRATGDATARPVTITVPPSSVKLEAAR